MHRVTNYFAGAVMGDSHQPGSRTTTTVATVSTAPAPASLPGPPSTTKLTSISQLDTEIQRARVNATRLVEGRDAEQRRLATVQQEAARLQREARQLTESVAKQRQAALVALNELDGVLQLRDRVNKRATQIARERQAQAESLPPETNAPSGRKQQRHPRAPLAVEINMDSESNFFVGFSENISEGGLFIATHHTRKVGDTFPVAFKLPGRPLPIHCMVEVAWNREEVQVTDPRQGVAGMGVRFVGLPPEVKQAIQSFSEQREALFFPELEELLA